MKTRKELEKRYPVGSIWNDGNTKWKVTGYRKVGWETAEELGVVVSRWVKTRQEWTKRETGETEKRMSFYQRVS